MGNVIVGRYEHPEKVGGWAGWIEPADRTWIMFVKSDGTPVVFLHRDPKTGAVL